MKIDLENKLALVTGGARGIGLGITKSLIECGAQVAIVGRDENQLILAETDLGEACKGFTLDVADTSAQEPVLGAIREHFDKPIDVLVNNAGNHLKKPALETSDADFATILNTHVHAAFALTRAVISTDMLPRESGKIVFLSSMAAYLAISDIVAYTTAKTAVDGLVRSLTAEFAPHNININAVAPGWIETDMMRRAVENDPERYERILNRIPANRLGNTKDIGRIVTFLCSDFANYIHGVTLPVDGGAVNSL